jgi:hypothetical protein
MRTVERCPAPRDRFPIPPTHDLSACSILSHPLCTDPSGNKIEIIEDGINRLDVPLLTIDQLGGYLFQCLIGSSWTDFERLAGPASDVELEILIEDDDQDLQSLWWEMMFYGRDPLAVQKTRKVAITRIVESAKPVAQPASLQMPLKVLFVVGRQIDDTLRPGAELIGLLNRVPLPLTGNFDQFQTAHLHVRLVQDAAWDDIEKAMVSFRPNVVHIVSHGELDPAGDGTRLLLTAREPEDPNNPAAKRQKTAEPYPCSAPRLLELITVNGSPPAVVVVNACHSAEAGGQGRADASFTAELVRGGVAVALGMSGEVADRACQIFAMSFYQGILRGVPVTLAAAQGRRAALLDFPEDTHTVEWARPTLFMAAGVAPALGVVPAARDWNRVAERFRTLTPAVMCDRLDCMDRYENFHTSLPPPAGRSAAFAFIAKEKGGVGKTRLLEEIAARSVFDNFIPVIVRNNHENPEAPQNHLEIGLQISKAIEKTREHFGLPLTPVSLTRQFAFRRADITPNPNDPVEAAYQEEALQKFILDNRMRGLQAVRLDTVLPLIQAECKALRDELRAPPLPDPIVLLLLDDLHRYASCVPDLLPRIREFGLGRPDLILPVVFTCNGMEEDKLVEDALRQRQDIFVSPLAPFECGTMLRLACRQFVLSKWNASVSARRDKSEAADIFYQLIEDFTKGCPQGFWLSEVEVVVARFKKNKTLVPTNFEEMLGRWK